MQITRHAIDRFRERILIPARCGHWSNQKVLKILTQVVATEPLKAALTYNSDRSKRFWVYYIEGTLPLAGTPFCLVVSKKKDAVTTTLTASMRDRWKVDALAMWLPGHRHRPNVPLSPGGRWKVQEG